MLKSTYVFDFEQPIRELEDRHRHLCEMAEEDNLDLAREIESARKKIEAKIKEIYSRLTSWQKVQISRHPQRPYSQDYIKHAFEDFQEIHGDRNFRDDQAIFGGTAKLNGRSVMVIGQQKGRDMKENILRNFGCPNPEGYRKALRLMKMAEKFKLPIITLVDTPGAYPGVESEERHVAEAIAVNIRDMSLLNVPIISAVIGEGGSGGALGIAVADKVLIFEFAYYSVISPEGCAAILWKDRAHASDAADALKLGSSSLIKFGVADTIMPEPLGGAHRDHEATAATLKRQLISTLEQLEELESEERLRLRYEKYRQIGKFLEK
jgi:acetyl-CoA carboxylase carboxyl transferase subunit alpha